MNTLPFRDLNDLGGGEAALSQRRPRKMVFGRHIHWQNAELHIRWNVSQGGGLDKIPRLRRTSEVK